MQGSQSVAVQDHGCSFEFNGEADNEVSNSKVRMNPRLRMNLKVTKNRFFRFADERSLRSSPRAQWRCISDRTVREDARSMRRATRVTRGR